MNQKVKVSPHVCGMLKEYHVLTQRIGKFNCYLNNCPSTKELHEQELQLAAMRLYAYHLAKRIEMNGTDPEKTNVNELFRHDGYISSDAAILQRFFRQNSNEVLTVLADLKELCGYAQFTLNTAVGKVIFDTNTDEKQGEKKELKKIEQKPVWSEEEKKKLDRIYYILGIAADEHAYSNTCRLIGDKEAIELQDFLRSIAKPEQKSDWSEEDEKMLNLIIGDYERGNESWMNGQNSLPFGNRILWLKSLKSRVQPKQEWSEEDRKMIDSIYISLNSESIAEGLRCRGIKYYADDLETMLFKQRSWLKSIRPQQKQEWNEKDEKMLNNLITLIRSGAHFAYEEEIAWLKSLSPKNTWKSSEEQEAPAIKSCPGIKFRVGDMVVCHDEKDRYFGTKHRIAAVYPEHGVYVCEDLLIILIKDQESYGLWEPGPSADDDNINNN